MTTINLTDCTIYLDAGFDLYQAGHDNSPEAAADYTAAYYAAARQLGEMLGVKITIAAPPCSEYGGLDGNNVESEEWARDAEVWQGLHSSLYQDDDGEWLHNDAAVAKLAKSIRG